VPVSALAKVSLVHASETPPTLYLVLKDGARMRASPPALGGIDPEALVAALRQVAPLAKVEHIVRD
jgi:hypothetical protein